MTRYTALRKQAIVLAIRSGELSRDEALQLHNLSEEELQAWERDFDRYGAPGLRSTRLQLYRAMRQRRRPATGNNGPRADTREP